MSSRDVTPASDLSATMQHLVDLLADMPEDRTPPDVVQLLLTVAGKRYVAARTAGHDFGPLVHDDALNATEVMVLVSNLLHAAEIEIFELAMWAMPGSRPTPEEVSS